MRPTVALACALLLVSAPVLAQHEGHGMPAAAPPSPDAPTVETHDPSGHTTANNATPAATLPPPTEADRAAAFPDLHGMDMRGHMDDDPFTAMLQVDQLEWRAGDDALAWDMRAWAGYSFNRMWLRSEGSRREGDQGQGQVELLWGHAMDPWWDVVAGLRHDHGGEVSRDWLAIGVQGLAPYKFEVEATAYVGESGRFGASLEVEYDVLLSNRLILQPKLGVSAYSRDDPGNHIGRGISETSFGLRLRYEWHRQFAPYLGYQWSRSFGRSADFDAARGEPALQHGWVAGVRFWF